MKTAVWLYLFMFVAFFDLHAQYPILSPFAISLGAAPSFIGLILGVYSITHIPGNLLAGYGVDKYGSKPFIVFSLLIAGLVLLAQSKVSDPWDLLYIRSISGFVLAFLSPACLSLLAKLASDQVQQGKLMAGNGMVHTIASVLSPAAGAYLVAQFGFERSFTFLGWGLIVTGLLAWFGVKESRYKKAAAELFASPASGSGDAALPGPASGRGSSIPWLFFSVPLSISCSQGILFFELPLMKETHGSILTSGVFFSLVSLGALVTLSMLFLSRIAPLIRVSYGALALAIIFFGMSVKWPLPMYASLILIGMAKGVIFPAIASLLAASTTSQRYGRVFSLLSISYSIGAFIGPMLAGHLRTHVSSYFLAFLCLMVALSLLPLRATRTPVQA
ncbi:MFS transporter [Paenibacillus mucilaginosus]|uniref:Major facilitator superfamily protein n=2 Tax=Paenibacillus mucilaginosus TaxID=61624 RepID=H6NC03_9BACL|nr:MFS transporter [Paenibacillus mucilaginosus]AEI42245.1 major facilitator superfamily MFS_1 [Paenibacillus mucilaginosus KNP414]AFC28035.1 major facilitator superfamily protein [Paenibacillus mucilaginosus 3016]MCG7214207.1 MFS transporter [Paenibacillus mucilaginosus]WDM28721.1 MFS transporter [Paenibacillus mucilaginosus]WFA22469.1 MFS transporter [Paenibacillus mucilaginosus]